MCHLAGAGKLLLCYLFVLLLLHQGDAKPLEAQSLSTPLHKFIFASCNDQDETLPWEHLSKFQPEMFLWLGDAIYADNWAEDREESIEVMNAKWRAAKEAPAYQSLRNHSVITGVWDDHDFGSNNGGSEYINKEETQKMFLNFLDEPSDSVRWSRPGVYTSFVWGPEGQRVLFLLLDVRYFKGIAPTGDILGETQWQWLETELQQHASNVNLVIVVSGIQIIPVKPRHEKWADYPTSRQRLLTLLLNSPAKNVILLTGDIHYAEMSELRCGHRHIIEATSSGLTHSVGTKFALTSDLHHQIGPNYLGQNFGTIEIQWEAQPAPVVLISAREVTTGDVALQLEVALDTELHPACSAEELTESLQFDKSPPRIHSSCTIDPNGTCIRRRRSSTPQLVPIAQ